MWADHEFKASEMALWFNQESRMQALHLQMELLLPGCLHLPKLAAVPAVS